MYVNKLQKGVYKINDNKGTWIAKGGVATINGKWTAYEASDIDDCTTANNWGVQYDTFKELIKYAQNN